MILSVESFFIAGSFIIANILNEATVAFILTIFMQPAYIILTFSLVNYRLSKITPISGSLGSDFYLLELSARESLKSGNLGEGLLKLLNKNYKVTRNKCNLVMQANYSADLLENPMLGLIKISRTNCSGFDFHSNFQVFKCTQNLYNANSNVSDGFKLFKYLFEFQKVKTEDQELCECLLLLSEKILEKDSQLSEKKKMI